MQFSSTAVFFSLSIMFVSSQLYAQVPALSDYIRDRAASPQWSAALSLDDLNARVDRCQKTSSGRDTFAGLALLSANKDLLDASLSADLAIASLTKISRSERVYVKLSDTIDEVGSAYFADFQTFHSRLQSISCRDMATIIESAEDLYIGLGQDLFPFINLYTEAFGLENFRLLLGANPAPLVSDLDVVSPEEAVKRSSGKILLVVGPGFNQTSLDTLVRNLANDEIEVELAATDVGSTMTMYFYSNRLPAQFSAAETTQVKQLIVSLLEKFADEIAELSPPAEE